MMLNISKLTSKKLKIKYIIIYALYSFLYLTSPLIVMQFINSVVDRNFNALVFYAILYFFSFVAIQIVSYFFSMMVGKVEANNFVAFFSKLDHKMKKYDFRNNNLDINDLNQHIGQNYEIANPYFFIQPVELVFSIINIIAIFIIMFIINWKITLILIVIVPCSFLVSKLFERKMYLKAEENLKNIKNVKEFLTDQFKLSKEERFIKFKQLGSIDYILGKYKKTQYENYKTKSIYLYFFTYCFLNFAILIVIVLSGFLTYEEQIAIGVLYAFQNYTSQLWNPGEFLMSYSANYQQAKPALNDLDDLLDLNEIDYSSEKIDSIKLSNLQILDKEGVIVNEKITYNFELGHTYVICGENGCGKTTIIEAIMGFNNRYIGEILINDKKIISDDIVYISANAYLSSFYNKEYKKLSSGQKKFEQIKLFLKTEKNVYIFDEPTNFIDENKRLLIIDLINELEKLNKIIIIVTHDEKFLSITNDVLSIKKITV